MPGVTIRLNGVPVGITGCYGNYQVNQSQSGTITPFKARETPGSPSINTIDVVAVQRHFLVIGPPLSGCRLTAADVNGDGSVNTTDVIAIQRFYLGLSTGIANVGTYQFTPPGFFLCYYQPYNDFDTLIIGDVATGFVYSPIYTVSTGSIVPGTTDTGNHGDNVSTPISLPFSFDFFDQTFTTAKVGSNGHLTFGTVNNDFFASCIPQSTTTYAIFPYRTDLCTGACNTNTGTNLGIFTSISGSAPNRVFNIEWRAAYYDSGQTTNIPLNFEVRLYEGLRDFDVIYGTIVGDAADRADLSVGAQRTDTSDYVLVGCDIHGGLAPPVSSGQLYHYTLGGNCPSPTPGAGQ